MKNFKWVHYQYYLLAIVIFFCHYSHAKLIAHNNDNLITAEQAFIPVIKKFNAESIEISWDIHPQTYLYKDRISIEEPSNETKWFNALLPKAEQYQDLNLGEQNIYRHTLNIKLTLNDDINFIKLHEPYLIKVNYQGCHAQGFCYPPQTFILNVTMNEAGIKEVKEASSHENLITDVENNNEQIIEPKGSINHFKSKLSETLDSAWGPLIFYLLGVLLGFTPCVLPMIPILIGIIAGPALTQHPKKAARLTLVYVLTIAITYSLAGMLTALVGGNIQAELQRPIYIILFAILFIYLGLSQLGVVKLKLPGPIYEKLNLISQKQPSGTYLGSIILGILATLLASPCVTAPLVAILSYISQTGDILFGGLNLFMLGLGMGTILLVAGTLGSHYLPKAGPWMAQLNRLIALMLFGLSIWILSRITPAHYISMMWGGLLIVCASFLNTFNLNKGGLSPRIGVLILLYGIFLIINTSGHFDLMIKTSQYNTINENVNSGFDAQVKSMNQLEDALISAKKENKIALLDFYADWCISCKKMEDEIFNNKKFSSLLDYFYIIKVNVTAFDLSQKEIMQSYGVIAPPTFIFIDNNLNEISNTRMVGEIENEVFKKNLENLLLDFHE